MKVLTWNCNRAFRKKYHFIEQFDADILIIQECEDPARCKDASYQEFASNYLWIGTNKNFGLGIFAKDGIKLDMLEWDAGRLELFLPCRVNDEFNLLAVWTKHAVSPTFQYIGQMWKYLQEHKRSMAASDLLIAGDLNSNACWDVWDRWWNHSDVVRELEEIGLKSIYHHFHSETQGNESQPTFFMRKNIDQPYHIDYQFGSRAFYQAIQNIMIGKVDDWLEVSDHMPFIAQY